MSGVPTEFDPLSVSSGSLPPGLVFTDYIELTNKEIHTGIYSARNTAYDLECSWFILMNQNRRFFSAESPEGSAQRVMWHNYNLIIAHHNNPSNYTGGWIDVTGDLNTYHTFYLSSDKLLFDGNLMPRFAGGSDYTKSEIIVNYYPNGNTSQVRIKRLNIIGADDGKNHLLLPAIAPDGRPCLVDMTTKKLLFEEP